LAYINLRSNRIRPEAAEFTDALQRNEILIQLTLDFNSLTHSRECLDKIKEYLERNKRNQGLKDKENKHENKEVLAQSVESIRLRDHQLLNGDGVTENSRSQDLNIFRALDLFPILINN